MLDGEDKDGLEELVLPLIIQVNGGLPRVIGSCVVIAVAKRRAVAFAARHVIEFMFDMVDVKRIKELKVAAYFQKVRFGESFSDGAGKLTLSDSLKLSAVRMSDSAVARVTGIS